MKTVYTLVQRCTPSKWLDSNFVIIGVFDSYKDAQDYMDKMLYDFSEDQRKHLDHNIIETIYFNR